MDLSFWASVIFFPLFVATILSTIRLKTKHPQANATEVLGILAVLDFASAVDPVSFYHSGTPSSLHQFVAVMIALVFLSGVSVTTCVLALEPRIVAFYAGRTTGTRAPFPFRFWVSSWVFVAVLFALHAGIYSGRIRL